MALDLSNLPNLRTPPIEQQAILAETLGVRACVVDIDGVETPAVAVMVQTADGRASVPFLFRPGFDWRAFADQAAAATERAAANIAQPGIPVPSADRGRSQCHHCKVPIFRERADAGHCGSCPPPAGEG